jgi:hypothetical protein
MAVPLLLDFLNPKQLVAEERRVPSHPGQGHIFEGVDLESQSQ